MTLTKQQKAYGKYEEGHFGRTSLEVSISLLDVYPVTISIQHVLLYRLTFSQLYLTSDVQIYLVI